MKKRFFRYFRLRTSRYARVCLLILCAAIPVHLLAIFFPAFADAYNETVGNAVRGILAAVSSIVPFSLCEAALIGLPVIAAILITTAFRKMRRGGLVLKRFYSGLLATLTLIYSTLVFGFGTGYHATPLHEKMNLSEDPVSPEQLYEVSLYLAERVNEEAEHVTFRFADASEMPYGIDGMNAKLLEAFRKTCEKYDFLHTFPSRVKPVILSEPWTYTHIAGCYSFFTGESNLNVNFPEYTLPFTTAHELSHQRGIARENEANFVAFLVCRESDDAYIRYSGYLNLLEYFLTPLHSADPEGYLDVLSKLSLPVRYEMDSYSRFFDRYRENGAADISEVFNNTYLHLQGQSAGTKSYGLVVDLGVAYYCAVLKDPE